MLTALQACSQKTLQPFEKKSYPFPIPTTEQPRKTMKELAEQQAEEVKKLLADPYDGGTKLTVDLRRIGDSEWCYPLPGAKVISNYGGRDGRQHTGVDLKTRPNDSILAVFDGIVIMSAPFSAYGNCIILAHENGLQTLYSHNVKNLVKEGDFVKVGQPIALTGRTGRATTEHLHFEVRVAGKNYNPNILFEHNTRKLQKHKLVFSKNGGVSIKK
jgi:murein DD-endopeptidase MepM/ murein hydrolase activator NlpD